MTRLSDLQTEQSNYRSRKLDQLPTEKLLRVINREASTVPRAVARRVHGLHHLQRKFATDSLRRRGDHRGNRSRSRDRLDADESRDRAETDFEHDFDGDDGAAGPRQRQPHGRSSDQMPEATR